MALIAYQEAGFTPKSEDEEVLSFISRLLLKDIMKNGDTPDEKEQMFGASFNAFKSNYLDRASSFVVHDNFVWILGDTERTSQDLALCLGVYKYRTNIIEVLAQQGTSLPDELMNLTVGFVKEYVASWQDIFLNNEFKDMYGASVMTAINDALSKSSLSDTDHFALLYQYLVDNNATDEMVSLNNKLCCFLSQKQDLEFQRYADAITESGHECDQAVVIAGASHTQLLRDYLATKGYTIMHQAGIEITDGNDLFQPSYYDHIVQQAATLNNNFDVVAQSVLA